VKRKLGKLLVLGAGGHGLVIAEAAQAAGWDVQGFRDASKAPGTPVGAWEVIASLVVTIPPKVKVIVGIGDNATRQRISEEMEGRGAEFATVIHPSAIISPSAIIGSGVFVGPRALVHAEAEVATGAIVNSAAVVEHHNHIGAYSHVASGATLAGTVKVGERVLIGAGSAVKPGMSITSDCVVGAGSAVVRHLEEPGIYVGVPAKLKQPKEDAQHDSESHRE